MEFIYFILGSCSASFVICLAYRINRQKNLGGLSCCDYCGRRLSLISLIPIIGWLACLGKCRYCKKLISIYYPLIEFLLAICFVNSKDNYHFLVIYCLLLFLSCEDIYDHTSHAFILYPVISFEFIINFLSEKTLGLLILTALLLFFIYYRKSLGNGDMPVILLMYLTLPVLQFSVAILISSCLTILAFLFCKKKSLAFIPFLAIGFLLLTLFV
ncbi:prepilin peptidase [Oenococcus sp. UCMA 16435]|nr:prepilin peptidase [Oenococcus sp. UCMA 16435]MDI4584201.1 prepilin peptidase [Oenococcus sp. UCMA 14587]